MKTIKRVDTWSLAKMEGGIAFAVGLIFGLIQWLSLVLVGPGLSASLMMDLPAGAHAGGSLGFGTGTFAGLGFVGFVFSAAFIGVLGFVGGLITAWVYNFLAPRIGGGVKVELGED